MFNSTPRSYRQSLHMEQIKLRVLLTSSGSPQTAQPWGEQESCVAQRQGRQGCSLGLAGAWVLLPTATEQPQSH